VVLKVLSAEDRHGLVKTSGNPNMRYWLTMELNVRWTLKLGTQCLLKHGIGFISAIQSFIWHKLYLGSSQMSRNHYCSAHCMEWNHWTYLTPWNHTPCIFPWNCYSDTVLCTLALFS